MMIRDGDNMVKFTVLIFSLFLSGQLFAQQQTADQITTTQAHSTVTLVNEHNYLYAGHTYYIGLDIKLDPKWHTYWINPGDSASASIFNFTPVPGVSFKEPLYPTPSRYKVGPFYSFGYEDRVLIQFPVEISKRYSQQAVPIEVEAEWLVCKQECIPGIFTFKTSLPTLPYPAEFTQEEFNEIKQATLNPEYKVLFQQSRHSWPTRLEGEIIESNETVEITFSDVSNIVDIFPYPNAGVSNDPAETVSKDNGTVSYKFKTSNLSESKDQPRFLISYKGDTGALKSHMLSSSKKWMTSKIGLMILFGFIGGLILNLMPCVFPILMLKVFQVMKSHENQNIKASTFFYVLGILVSFWILASIILILQSLGQLAGWGFQLQSPLFTSGLILLFLLMGVYFLDILPFPESRFLQLGNKLGHRQGHLGSFLTGVLAVIVASPCTAPFMGAAMGYALSRSAYEVFAIFTSLGLGLGFPFILLAAFPNSLSWLPRPGAWMAYFKKFMALPLFATAAWLIWVLVQLTSTVEVNDGYWQAYTPEKVEQLKNEQPIFVNFTAAWCISCQVNEAVAFQDPKVKEFVADHNILMLKADWTKKNPEIANVLKSYDRAGVPLYLFFSPQTDKVKILPEVLTPQILIQILKDELNLE